MHTGLHTLAHRAPGGATRTRVRWQPYSATTSNMPSRSSPTSSYPNTPKSVSPYSTPATSFDSDKPKQTSNPPPSKHTKYATGLVDQAVKSLCEIWRNQDIPPVFQTTLALSGTPAKAELVANPPSNQNTQLLSPISPNTQSSPPTAQCEANANSMFGSKTNLVPIKGFVHEVLRRSRTSGCVLQTALCYLEAIRPKIPELAEQEKSGLGCKAEPVLADRITPATSTEIEQEVIQLSLSEDAEADNMDTVKLSDVGTANTDPKAPTESLIPLPPLPSPLLCPRRAFLAALILASKFTQDKCYSNRAWAKLSGLPAREIGRCERALGDALDWRLWVGKTPAASQTPQPGPSRSLVRCQSESDLKTPKHPTFLAQDEDAIPVGNALRRSSTLPVNAFSLNSRQESSTAIPARNLDSDYAMTVEMPSLSMIPSAFTQYPADIECPPTELIDPNPPASFSSPCPSLSSSPSSTDSSSSSGDRTIQMSSFVDEMPSCTIGALSSESWPWLESPPSVIQPSKQWHGGNQHPPEVHIVGLGQDHPPPGVIWFNGSDPPWTTVV